MTHVNVDSHVSHDETKLWSQVGLDYVDPTLESHTTLENTCDGGGGFADDSDGLERVSANRIFRIFNNT